jgi:hypothetical protein
MSPSQRQRSTNAALIAASTFESGGDCASLSASLIHSATCSSRSVRLLWACHACLAALHDYLGGVAYRKRLLLDCPRLHGRGPFMVHPRALRLAGRQLSTLLRSGAQAASSGRGRGSDARCIPRSRRESISPTLLQAPERAKSNTRSIVAWFASMAGLATLAMLRLLYGRFKRVRPGGAQRPIPHR